MKFWIKAFRLRTLPLSVSGWLVGLSLVDNDIPLNLTVAGLTLLTAILLQTLSNLANDYGDATSGVDDSRIGEARMVSSGKISTLAMKNAIIVFSILAFISGLWLLYRAFPDHWISALVFLTIGIIGIATAIKYTVGKNPYSYTGFGDLFVFTFFGIVLVFGTYYLQVQNLNWQVLLPASSLGLFSVGVLNVNNIRDIESDKIAGKYSIPVRIGRRKAVIYHKFLLVNGMICSIIYFFLNYTSWTGLIFILVSKLLIKNMKAVTSKPANQLDPYLKQMTIATLLFSILFSFNQLINRLL